MSKEAGILARYVTVLEAIATSPGGLSLTEIVQSTDLPRGTVHRLLGALASVGFIAPREGTKIYLLGPRLLRLLHVGMVPVAVAALARPLLEDLARRFRETAFVAKLVGLNVQSAAMATPESEGQSHVQPGRVMPLHAAASAKAIFAFQDESLIGKGLDLPRARFTGRTRIDEQEVRHDLERVRRQGYAICDEELDPGVLSYACPVHLEGAGVLYSIGLVGLSQRLGSHRREDVVAALRRAADEISRTLPNGHDRPPVADAQVTGEKRANR